MSFIADVSIDMPLMAPTHEAVPAAEATLADYHHVSDDAGEDRFVLFLWTTSCPFDGFEAAMGADETVESYEALADSADRRLYRVYSTPFPDDGFLLAAFLREHGIALHQVTRDAEGLHFRGQFPTREALQALRRGVVADDGWFRLNAVYSAAAAPEGEPLLTERQREALRIAERQGYFETPAEATLAEVAEDLDVTPQAVSSHLRAAVRKLVGRALAADDFGRPGGG